MKYRAMLAAAVLVLGSQWSQAAEPPRTPGVPTVWLVGDSTVHNGTHGEEGWGEEFIKLFDPSKVRVINRAMGGRSSRSFIDEGRWDQVLQDAEKGDYVIIQMGHNDGGPLAGDNRERGSIRGTGDETKDVTLTLGDNKGKKYTVHTYGWYLTKYVTDARDKGLKPIICSWIPHCPKPGDKVEPEGEPTSYRLWAKQVAEKENVPFIDLYAITWHKYMKMTPSEIKEKIFTPADNTHTSPVGAKINAQSVAQGLEQLKKEKDIPLADYLKPNALENAAG
ncbi:MAG: rhamnogalacturonan acetylesterase [Tepidisphaeraceae bacterium]